MRRKIILGAILAVLLAIAGVPLAFAGGDDNGDDNGDDVRTLRLTATSLQEAEIDLGASGFSIGDRFVESQNLFRDDERVGVGGIDCVLVVFRPGPDPAGEPEAATAQCVATASLPQGQITVQGLIDFTDPGPFTLAITGGTGAYRTAHGEVEVTEESPEFERIRFKLILNGD
jgi:hypothetical protein